MAKDIIIDNTPHIRLPKKGSIPRESSAIDLSHYAPLLPSTILKSTDEFYCDYYGKGGTWQITGRPGTPVGTASIYRRPLGI